MRVWKGLWLRSDRKRGWGSGVGVGWLANLRVVAERHVLAESQRRARSRRLLDVHTGGVDLGSYAAGEGSGEGGV